MFNSPQNYERTFLSPFEILDQGQLPIEHRVFTRPKPVPKKRPGKPPAKADSELSPAELITRNRRRERNKRAAQRGRNRIGNTIASLESEVNNITTENEALKSDNNFHRQEVNWLRHAIFSVERMTNVDEDCNYEAENYPKTEYIFAQNVKTEVPNSDINHCLHNYEF